MEGHGRKKSFSERSLTSSKDRTRKKGRKTPRKGRGRAHHTAVRTQQTTGRIDFVFDEDGKPTKVFTPA